MEKYNILINYYNDWERYRKYQVKKLFELQNTYSYNKSILNSFESLTDSEK